MSTWQQRWWSVGLTVMGVMAVAVSLAAVLLFPKWRAASENGGQRSATPFRIAGNLYYVGASDTTAFLITGPQGHVLIDGGFPGTAKMILASVAELGFQIKDVKILLSTDAAYGLAGGLAELQKVSGAQLWASEASADALAAGGANPGGKWSLTNLVVRAGIQKYQAPRVDHRLKDGERIRLGPIELTAFITSGTAGGCTALSYSAQDGDRVLRIVKACGVRLGDPLAPMLPVIKRVDAKAYAEIRSDYERRFQLLRSLPADIWLTSHAREWDRYRKFLDSAKVKNPVDAFIDRAGYLEYINKGEKRLRELFAE